MHVNFCVSKSVRLRLRRKSSAARKRWRHAVTKFKRPVRMKIPMKQSKGNITEAGIKKWKTVN